MVTLFFQISGTCFRTQEIYNFQLVNSLEWFSKWWKARTVVWLHERINSVSITHISHAALINSCRGCAAHFFTLLLLAVEEFEWKKTGYSITSRCRINIKEIEIELAFQKNMRTRKKRTYSANSGEKNGKELSNYSTSFGMNEYWIYYLIQFQSSHIDGYISMEMNAFSVWSAHVTHSCGSNHSWHILLVEREKNQIS